MRFHACKSVHYIYGLLIILGSWQLLAAMTDRPILLSPWDIFMHLYETFHSSIAVHVLYSLRRTVLGISLSLAIGVPLGVLTGYFKKIDRLFSPMLYFSYPIPKMALLPVVMLLFGLGEATKVIMIFLIIFFPIVVNIRDEVKNIPGEVYEPMYSLGAKPLQVINEIILPGIVPAILTSLRIGIGTAISVLFFTENFGTVYGMGYFIMDAWMRVNYMQMYSGIVVLSILGLICFIIIDCLEVFICRWKSLR